MKSGVSLYFLRAPTRPGLSVLVRELIRQTPTPLQGGCRTPTTPTRTSRPCREVDRIHRAARQPRRSDLCGFRRGSRQQGLQRGHRNTARQLASHTKASATTQPKRGRGRRCWLLSEVEVLV